MLQHQRLNCLRGFWWAPSSGRTKDELVNAICGIIRSSWWSRNSRVGMAPPWSPVGPGGTNADWGGRQCAERTCKNKATQFLQNS